MCAPGPFQTRREQEQDVATCLAALQQFKGVARSVVRNGCNQQPQGAMCSVDTVFDLICANHHADMPEEYYETMRLMDNSASDLDILRCSEIAGLYCGTAI